ncbi:hypothetical protein V565_320290 [Rhizoctonia solani 123E]|uniref:Uncharacterized protein n=1 Tax=Rhizoctonia solani 123E TaxID=1423351 RepID=A0A074RK30_9AGAM|nr:hypothetical protein V565_320290 [Rhizoctonia solani 123E]
MPPRKKFKLTTPRRQSQRKKSSTVAKSTQIKVADSQKGTKRPAHLSESSSEVDTWFPVVDTLGAYSGTEVEIIKADGVDKAKKVDEIDEDDEVDEIESTSESEELELSTQVEKSGARLGDSEEQSDESTFEIVKPNPPSLSDPEVEDFFEDAVRATVNNTPTKSSKIKSKTNRVSKPMKNTESGKVRKRNIRKTTPEIGGKPSTRVQANSTYALTALQIDTSDLVVPTILKARIQLPRGTRQLDFSRHSSFHTFKHEVADKFGLPTKDLELTYSTREMKRNDRRFLLTNTEFADMVEEVVRYFKQQIEAIRSERLKDAAAVHNARGRGRVHIPKAPREIPDPELTIYNLSPTEDTGRGSKIKEKDSTGKEPKLPSLSARVENARDRIENNPCKECGVPCCIVYGPDAKPKHVRLLPQHIDLWADQFARGLCTLSTPPPSLKLRLLDAASVKKHGRAESEEPMPLVKRPKPTSPPSNVDQGHTGPSYPIYPPPVPYPSMGVPLPYSNHPSPYFVPSGPYPTFLPTMPYAGAMGPFPPYQPVPPGYPPSFPSSFPSGPDYTHRQRQRGAPGSPWLSDWLPSLDYGERGRFEDQFGLLVSGFAAIYIVCLSHLRDYSAEDLTRISFFLPNGSPHHLGLGAARRLVTYAREDQPLIDPVHEETGSSQPKAGSSTQK